MRVWLVVPVSLTQRVINERQRRERPKGVVFAALGSNDITVVETTSVSVERVNRESKEREQGEQREQY